jgi:hypothetical protein
LSLPKLYIWDVEHKPVKDGVLSFLFNFFKVSLLNCLEATFLGIHDAFKLFDGLVTIQVLERKPT